MGKKKHKKVSRKGNFCAIRTLEPCNDCPSSKNYRDICKPAGAWKFITYGQQNRKIYGRRRPWEAHHLLTVACVNRQIVQPPAIDELVRETKWCINNEDNMLAMPMWGHTIRWYFNMAAVEVRMITLPDGSKMRKTSMKPPPFKDIPQHNYGHNTYSDEVDTALADLVDDIMSLKDPHEYKPEDLEKELNDLSSQFRDELCVVRGKRCDGTHEGWNKGLKDRSSNWYEPFSMSETPRKITFPFTDPDNKYRGEMGRKIEKLVRFFWTRGIGV